MHRGWLAAVALLVLGLVPQATGQADTQPEATVEVGPFEEALPPAETTEIEVNASISCEGWGEGGQRTLALFSLKGAPSAYEVSFEPAQIDVPAGPDECQPGEVVGVTTTLEMRPTREADAGDHFSLPVELRLEERTDGETVNEYGPYGEKISFRTGFLAELDATLLDGLEPVPSGQPARATIALTSEANAPARFRVNASEDLPGLRIETEPPHPGVAPGERTEVTVIVRQTSLDGVSGTQRQIRLNGTFLGPDGNGGLGPQESSTYVLQAEFTPLAGEPDVALPVGLWGLTLAVTLVAARPWRSTSSSVPPGAEAQRVDLDRLETALARWLGVTAAAGLLAGVFRKSPLLFGAGLAAAVGGLGFATVVGLPDACRRLASRLRPAWVGAGLVAAGVVGTAAASAATAEILWLAAGLSLIAGAWVLSRGVVPAKARISILLAPIAFVIGPTLVAPIVVDAGGSRLFDVQLGEQVALALALWLPFLLASGALAARTHGLSQALALVATVDAAALALIPEGALGGLLVGGTEAAVGLLVLAPLAASLVWLAKARGLRGVDDPSGGEGAGSGLGG